MLALTVFVRNQGTDSFCPAMKGLDHCNFVCQEVVQWEVQIPVGVCLCRFSVHGGGDWAILLMFQQYWAIFHSTQPPLWTGLMFPHCSGGSGVHLCSGKAVLCVCHAHNIFKTWAGSLLLPGLSPPHLPLLGWQKSLRLVRPWLFQKSAETSICRKPWRWLISRAPEASWSHPHSSTHKGFYAR